MSTSVILILTTGALTILAIFSVRGVHTNGLPWGVMSLALLGAANVLGWSMALQYLTPGIMAVSLILAANVIAITAAAFMHRYKDAAAERSLREARIRHYASESRIRREERRRGL